MIERGRLIEAGAQLTVIIRNEAPLRHAEAPPKFRRVTIDLTADQASALMLKQTDSIGNTPLYEEIDRVFFETTDGV